MKLQAMACRSSTNRTHLPGLDVTQPESISGFATQLANKPIDVLLNVAGVMAPAGQDELTTITKDTFTKIFEVNTYGPLLLTQALLPNLLESPSPRVGIVSSRVGSMGDNSTGGDYAYRASKAAVNSLGKSLAVELKEKNVVVSLLHPGLVRTSLNPRVQPGPETVEAEEAATKLWQVFLSKGLEETGKFWHREGYELPW